MEDLFSKTLYFKIPRTTSYSGDLSYFDKNKCYIVEGEEFCEKVQKLTFPVIVKPSNSSASRGITVFENYEELQIRACFNSQ